MTHTRTPRYAVICTDYDAQGNGPAPQRQCGAAVKTVAKAYALMARMREQRELGSSKAYRVVTVTDY